MNRWPWFKLSGVPLVLVSIDADAHPTRSSPLITS